MLKINKSKHTPFKKRGTKRVSGGARGAGRLSYRKSRRRKSKLRKSKRTPFKKRGTKRVSGSAANSRGARGAGRLSYRKSKLRKSRRLNVKKNIPSIEDFLKNKLKRIGEGGFGTVYTNTKYPSFALKKSKKPHGCNTWKKEFEIHSDIYQKFKQQFGENKIIEVIPVYEMKEINNYCYILMDRICPIEKESIKDVKDLYGKSVHALIGQTSKPNIENHKGRGIFVNQTIVSKLVNLPETVKALGIFMSWLQYKLKYDGVDLEFIIGQNCLSPFTAKIFVIDFGMVSKMDENMDIGNSLWAMPYFPLESPTKNVTNNKVEDIIKQIKLVNKEIKNTQDKKKISDLIERKKMLQAGKKIFMHSNISILKKAENNLATIFKRSYINYATDLNYKKIATKNYMDAL